MTKGTGGRYVVRLLSPTFADAWGWHVGLETSGNPIRYVGVFADRELAEDVAGFLNSRERSAATFVDRLTAEFIRDHYRDTGITPTNAEVAERFGISTTSAHDRLVALVRKGFAVRIRRAKRGLSLTASGEELAARGSA